MSSRVVFDMDVGIDDALAILFLAARSDVALAALGSVHGNGYVASPTLLEAPGQAQGLPRGTA